MRTRRDLTRKQYIKGMKDAVENAPWEYPSWIRGRRVDLEVFLGHAPNGRCHWPKCERGGLEDKGDADAYFCSDHCPICLGWWPK